MKNINITPTTLVPKKLRLEVYSEAKQIIESGKFPNKSKYPYGLCRLLPQLLWDINLSDSAPNGEIWNVNSIQNIFPELKKELKKCKLHHDYFTPKQRIDFLKSVTSKI